MNADPDPGRRPWWRRRLFWDLLALTLLVFSVAGAVVYVIQPQWPAHRGEGAPPVDAGRLEAHVRFLAEGCVPRDCEHPENLGKAADYIAESFRASGARVSELDYPVQKTTARVVRARFGPEGPIVLVVGAHYDAYGPHPAADDNASGVAGLLELGRLLGQHPPTKCVELAAYPHEELFTSPEMGSRHHAAALRQEGAPLVAMISLEMIGYFSDEPVSQLYPIRILKPFYPSRGNFVAVMGRSEERAVISTLKRGMAAGGKIPVRSVCAPFSVPGIDLSDHWSFWKEGYRGVMVTDTGFYRNDRYHSAEDTADTLDYARMAEVVRGVYTGVLALAQRD
jgi:hypothetical protein